ncbi:MAG TPA: rhomboid family intramembrane serine protease [Spirochaetota bacterium]|nr:rhomboid family intramembrane serine protease [Spirochaetota bacterium]
MPIVFTRYGSPARQVSSLTGSLIIAAVSAWLLQLFSGNSREFNTLFGFVPEAAIQRQHLWQFVSYMFLHGGFFHLLFNMVALHAFGRPLEGTLGKTRFGILFFLSGIGSALVHGLIAIHSTGGTAPTIPMIGASGAVMGVAAGFARAFPNAVIHLFGFIPVRAWTLILVYGIFELMTGLNQRISPIAHMAHFSGIVIGLGLMSVMMLVRFPGHQDRADRRRAPGGESTKVRKDEQGRTVIDLEQGDDGLWR